jgi:acetyl-CoA carboxylase biotin carboxyl carrier protein
VEEKVRELLRFAEQNGLMEMAWQENGVKIAFRRGGTEGGSAADTLPTLSSEEAAPVTPEDVMVRSPMVGIFRRALSKDRPPLVMEGNHIKPGDRLAVVECMKIPTDVTSFTKGEIKKVLVEDGQPVEYGQPLFEVIPHEEIAAGDEGTSHV